MASKIIIISGKSLETKRKEIRQQDQGSELLYRINTADNASVWGAVTENIRDLISTLLFPQLTVMGKPGMQHKSAGPVLISSLE